jgi:hypothetical protein
MIIRIALLLIPGALLCFLLGDFLVQLGLSEIAGIVIVSGISLLFAGFAVVFTAMVLLMMRHILEAFVGYFSREQRQMRGLLFNQTKLLQLKQLYKHKKIQLEYFSRLKRKQLLKANDLKEIYSLSMMIAKELKALRKNIPENLYSQFQNENKIYIKQNDSDSLIQLHKKLHSLTTHE